MEFSVSPFLTQLEAAAKALDHPRAAVLCRQLMDYLQEHLAMNPEIFSRELERRIAAGKQQAIETLCQQLIDHLRSGAAAYSEPEARLVLKQLLQARHFSPLKRVADALIAAGQAQNAGGQTAAVVYLQYAQGLIDAGEITAAIHLLDDLKQRCKVAEDKDAVSETYGLLGRAYKQYYVDAGDPQTPRNREYLQKSAECYAHIYDHPEFRGFPGRVWHGINLVALVKRAARDHLDLSGLPDADPIARELLDQIRARIANHEADAWDYATAAEAYVALGEYEQALEWIIDYTKDEQAGAFAYGSTLRQFEQVWQLDPKTKAHARLLHYLRSALLRQEDGRIQFSATDYETVEELARDVSYERVLGDTRYKTFLWYKTGLERALAVAKITDQFGNSCGTGFLLRGEQLHGTLQDETVLMTNSHVISPDPGEHVMQPRSLPPENARILFETKGGSDNSYLVKQVVFHSHRGDLDCTVVTLDRDPHPVPPWPVSPNLPRLDGKQRVYVIGHPKGGGLSFSIQDNRLLDVEQPKVHYRTPTEPGSSGSPVFDEQWALIALHHAGGKAMPQLHGKAGTYAANEGICLGSLLGEIDRELSS